MSFVTTTLVACWLVVAAIIFAGTILTPTKHLREFDARMRAKCDDSAEWVLYRLVCLVASLIWPLIFANSLLKNVRKLLFF